MSDGPGQVVTGTSAAEPPAGDPQSATHSGITGLVHRLQECFNARRFDDADALHAPGFVSHPLLALGLEAGHGIEAGKQIWRTLVSRYPGMRVVARDIVVEGDRAAVRSTVEGLGAEHGEPALFEMFRIEDGRFAEMWGAAAGFPTSGSPGQLADR